MFRACKKEQQTMLKQKFACDYSGGRCKRNECDRYKSCSRPTKKNFEAWVKAYQNGEKEDMERLMRGGL